MKKENNAAEGSIYLKIADELERRIVNAKWKLGQKLPSTNEMSKMFDVTPPTVQRSLARLVRKGFLKRTQRKGTFVTYGDPASGKIAIVFGHDPLKIESRYYSLLLDAVRHIAAAKNVAVKYYLDIDESDYGRTIREIESDIASGEVSTIVQAYEDCAMFKEWEATSETQAHFTKFPALNFKESVRLGLDYLVKRGFKKVAFISMGSPTRANELFERDGVRAALEENPGSRCDCAFLRGGDARKDGYEIIYDLLAGKRSERRPDALFIHHDVMTDGALQALAELKIKVPQDIALLTHSNKGAEFLSRIPLTRVEFDPKAIAERLFDYLTLKGEDRPDISNANPLKPRLKIGKSCGE